jgi:hypothetical protein
VCETVKLYLIVKFIIRGGVTLLRSLSGGLKLPHLSRITREQLVIEHLSAKRMDDTETISIHMHSFRWSVLK